MLVITMSNIYDSIEAIGFIFEGTLVSDILYSGEITEEIVENFRIIHKGFCESGKKTYKDFYNSLLTRVVIHHGGFIEPVCIINSHRVPGWSHDVHGREDNYILSVEYIGVYRKTTTYIGPKYNLELFLELAKDFHENVVISVVDYVDGELPKATVHKYITERDYDFYKININGSEYSENYETEEYGFMDEPYYDSDEDD